MTRKSRVAPDSSEENISAKGSNNNSLLTFENPELSSAITGKVIETNPSTNGLQLSDGNKTIKSSKNGIKTHKRIARSVSEVVEEKEKQERNVFSRFAHSYRRSGVYGIFTAIVDEVDLFISRCGSCSRYLFNKATCAKRVEEE